jgi:hypothetical protein
MLSGAACTGFYWPATTFGIGFGRFRTKKRALGWPALFFCMTAVQFVDAGQFLVQ